MRKMLGAVVVLLVVSGCASQIATTHPSRPIMASAGPCQVPATDTGSQFLTDLNTCLASAVGVPAGTAGQVLGYNSNPAPLAFTLSGDCTNNSSYALTCPKINGTTPGGTCTNQFVSSLSSSAVPSCGSQLTQVTLLQQLLGTDGTITHASGGTDTPNLANGMWQVDSVGDGNAFTIGNPSGITAGSYWYLRIANASGGALGTISFGTSYKAGTIAAPVNGKSRVLAFHYDGTSNWLITESPSDL